MVQLHHPREESDGSQNRPRQAREPQGAEGGKRAAQRARVPRVRREEVNNPHADNLPSEIV